MITEEDLDKILIVYFEEVYETKDKDEIAKIFGLKYSRESYDSEIERLNRSFGICEMVMGGGFGTLHWNPDRKIMICCNPEIYVAVWTNKPADRISKCDKQLKKKIEKRWAKMGYKILKYS